MTYHEMSKEDMIRAFAETGTPEHRLRELEAMTDEEVEQEYRESGSPSLDEI